MQPVSTVEDEEPTSNGSSGIVSRIFEVLAPTSPSVSTETIKLEATSLSVSTGTIKREATSEETHKEGGVVSQLFEVLAPSPTRAARPVHSARGSIVDQFFETVAPSPCHPCRGGVLIIPASCVAHYLTMRQCIAAVEDGLRGTEATPLQQYKPSVYPVPQQQQCYLSSATAFMVTNSKQYCASRSSAFFPAGNDASGSSKHNGAIMLFDAATGGELKAIIDASELTTVRSAAVSAVATRLLADPGSEQLAILGCGPEARAHLDAMVHVLPGIRRVSVWAHSTPELEAFREWASASYSSLHVETSQSVQEAVSGADVICTLTKTKADAPECLLRYAWLKRGAHVNAVGANTPDLRELDTALIVESDLYAESKEDCFVSGDLAIPLREEAIDKSHIKATVGELLKSQTKAQEVAEVGVPEKDSEVGVPENDPAEASDPAAEDDAENKGIEAKKPLEATEDKSGEDGAAQTNTPGKVTLFKNLGLMTEDLAAALVVLSNALAGGERGCTRVDLNGTVAKAVTSKKTSGSNAESEANEKESLTTRLFEVLAPMSPKVTNTNSRALQTDDAGAVDSVEKNSDGTPSDPSSGGTPST